MGKSIRFYTGNMLMYISQWWLQYIVV